MWQMLQFPNQLHSSLLDSVQYVHFSFVLGSPELDPAVQTCLISAKFASIDLLSNTAQSAIGLTCLKITFLAYVKLGVNQDHHDLFCRTHFQPEFPKLCWCTCLCRGRTLPFALLNSMRELLAHFIQPFLQSLWTVAHSSDVSSPASLYHLQTRWGYTSSYYLGS